MGEGRLRFHFQFALKLLPTATRVVVYDSSSRTEEHEGLYRERRRLQHDPPSIGETTLLFYLLTLVVMGADAHEQAHPLTCVCAEFPEYDDGCAALCGCKGR